MYRRRIHDQLPLHILLQNHIDSRVDRRIVAQADEDNVRAFCSIVDGINHFRLIPAKLCGEIVCPALGPVVQDQRLVQISFFHQILAHALSTTLVWGKACRARLFLPFPCYRDQSRRVAVPLWTSISTITAKRNLYVCGPREVRNMFICTPQCFCFITPHVNMS